MTAGLREARSLSSHALAAPIAGVIARRALTALGLSGDPFHVQGPASRILLLCVNVADDMDPRPQADKAPGPMVDRYAATHTVRLADARICMTGC